MNTYPFGTSVKVSGEFHDVNRDPYDPPDVFCLIKSPAGTETSYELGGGLVIRDSLGKFHLWVEGDIAGTWVYRWKGTGTAATANEMSFIISASRFTNP